MEDARSAVAWTCMLGGLESWMFLPSPENGKKMSVTSAVETKPRF